MTAEPQREFVDANVLVYAFDSSATSKQHAARRLLETVREPLGCLSVEVRRKTIAFLLISWSPVESTGHQPAIRLLKAP